MCVCVFFLCFSECMLYVALEYITNANRIPTSGTPKGHPFFFLLLTFGSTHPFRCALSCFAFILLLRFRPHRPRTLVPVLYFIVFRLHTSLRLHPPPGQWLHRSVYKTNAAAPYLSVRQVCFSLASQFTLNPAPTKDAFILHAFITYNFVLIFFNPLPILGVSLFHYIL